MKSKPVDVVGTEQVRNPFVRFHGATQISVQRRRLTRQLDKSRWRLQAPEPGTQLHNRIHAMALVGDGALYVIHEDGRMKVLSTEDGYVIREAQIPPPAWDGLAIAKNRVDLKTQTGELVCLGEE